MLNIEVNRSAEGVERYFDRELAVSDYLMKEPGIWAGRGAERLGLRGRGPTITVRSIVAKRKSDDGQTADGTYEHKPAGGRRKGQQPAGWLWARVRGSQVAQHLSGDHRRSGG